MEKIILILKIKFICNKKCTCKNFMIIKIGFIKIKIFYLIIECDEIKKKNILKKINFFLFICKKSIFNNYYFIFFH